MEADGALLTPLPLSVLRFTCIQNYDYTDQRRVKTDIRSLKIEPETSGSESWALANEATNLSFSTLNSAAILPFYL